MKRFKAQKTYFALVMLILGVLFIAGCGSGVEDLLPNPHDDTAPTVTSTVPDDGDGILIVMNNRKIIATFDEAMNPDGITDTGTFTLTGASNGAIAGPVTYSVLNHIAIFTPSADLLPDIYTATITTAAEDVSGNALAAAYTWSFTVAFLVDNTEPTMNIIGPLNGATGVKTDTDINITFSEVMDPETVNGTNFTLKTSGTSTAVPGIVTCTGTTATFNPVNGAILPGTGYIATVKVGVKDLAGNAMAAEQQWSFTAESGPL